MFWRKSRPQGPPPESEAVSRARERFGAGEAREALGLLHGALEAGSLEVGAAEASAYALAAEVSRAVGDEEAGALFGAVAKDPGDVMALFKLGYHFVGHGADRLGVPFLRRAHGQLKHPQIANELSLALTGSFRPQEAARVLDEVPGPLPFWPAYQRAWAHLLSDQPGPARELLVRAPDVPEPERDGAAYALQKLSEASARLALVGSPQPLIRDWQFIQYGGMILDFMDERVTEGGLEVAGGRYVWQGADHAHVHGVLLRLRRALEALELRPQAIWAAPDHGSQVLGHALSALLALPLAAGDADLGGPLLLVAAHHRDLLASDTARQTLQTVRADQVVFAFNVDWVGAGGMSPDVAGLLSQHLALPWEGNLRVNPDTQKVEQTPPDERPPHLIAADVLAAVPAEDPAFETHLAFYLRVRRGLTAGRPGAPRLPFRTDSPVPGSFFT